MPKNKYRVYRQALIDRRLRQKCCPTPSKKDLKDYIEIHHESVSISSIEKDIEDMRKTYELKILYDYNKGGYYYKKESKTFPQAYLEVLSLYMDIDITW